MPNITITVEDENLDYLSKASTGSFEIAEQKLDQLKRNYEARVAMELNEKSK